MNISNKDFPLILEIKSETRKSEVADLITRIKKFVEKDLKLPNNKPCITATQMKNIYSKVTECKNNLDFQLLRPQLAYIIGKKSNEQLEKVINLIDELLSYLSTILFDKNKENKVILTEEQYVENLHTFFEMIVAYHKFFYGEK